LIFRHDLVRMHNMSDYEIRLFGSPKITRDGAVASMDTRKGYALLALLAMQEGAQSRSRLALLLWPEADSSRARGALRRTLSALRKALGETGLVISRDEIGLDPDLQANIDVNRFDALCAEIAASESTACSAAQLNALSTAASLYRADFLAGFGLKDSSEFDEWQFFESERLRQSLARVLSRQALCQSETGDFEAAIASARRWLTLDSLQEEAHQELILLYSLSGQRNAALRQYRECVRILDAELGVPPLAATTALYQNVLENKAGRRPILRQKAALSSPAATRTHPGDFLLVGRQEQWAELDTCRVQTQQRAAFASIHGEAGIGKTRLAEEFARVHEAGGGLAVKTRSYRSESNLPYGPFVEGFRALLRQPEILSRMASVPGYWLAEATRLVPELQGAIPDLRPATDSDDPGAQFRLFEAIRQLLAALREWGPILFIIDDAHWLDPASFELLSYLVRRPDELSVMWIVIWRQEEVLPGSKLDRLETELLLQQRHLHLELDRLTEDEVGQLAAQADLQVGPVGQLFEQTEGLPFFVVEFIKSQLRHPVEDEAAWAPPPSVLELQKSRFTTVDDAGRQLLTAAAVIGRSFDFEILRATSGRSPDESVRALDDLIARGLLVELVPAAGSDLRGPAFARYDFSHESLYQAVYGEISLARRRILHRRVAEALIHAYQRSRHGAALVGQIGHHLQLAGEEQQAGEYFFKAGVYSANVHANIEALNHFQSALALSIASPDLAHEAIGDLHTLMGDYQAALNSYEAAAALTQDAHLPGVEHKLGNLHHRRGDLALAGIHFESAYEKTAADEQGSLRAYVLADWSRTQAQQGEFEAARRLAEQAVAQARSARDEQAESLALNILGLLALEKDQAEAASEAFQSALGLAEPRSAQAVAATNNLALVFREVGRTDDAIKLTEQALENCSRIGDRHREAALLNNLADLHHDQGHADLAMEYLRQAVEIFAEIGFQAGDLEPEIWKLTNW
jgi:DNA-binding SARP family transcriptional activator